MTTFLLTFLVIFAAGICVEGYFVIGNQQRTRTTNEQILAANMRLLALHPSKSAEPTTAPDDAPAYVPYAGLRDLPDDADRWADDGGPEPARGPDTRPAAAVLIDHAFDETGPIPVVPPVGEEWRARFTFREEASA